MTEQEFLARDAALLLEEQDERKICVVAQAQILDANRRMNAINAERIKLRQEYSRTKQGGQNND